MTIGALVAFAILCVVLAVQGVRRSRRRRWRAERKQRHARIEREWNFLRNVLGPKPKRLTYEASEADGAAD